MGSSYCLSPLYALGLQRSIVLAAKYLLKMLFSADQIVRLFLKKKKKINMFIATQGFSGDLGSF